ncbi:MAG: nitrilase family protein [Saprospiraceae bacterium]|nr:nitrilase family protein [Candidatus Defluviibacterium haderslevense]
MSSLSLALVQTSLVWEHPKENRLHFELMIREQCPPGTDLIILPEMFTTGFTMNNVVLAEEMEGETIQWLKKIAHQHQAAIMGSLIISESGRYFNRLVFIQPDSDDIQTYDKRHLFTLAKEDKYYTAGTQKLILEYKQWKIMPVICYDLRFPVWMRNTEAVDLIVCVANFPERRRKAWMSLLPARAIENVCYVLGLNRIGQDGLDIPYAGDSGIWDYEGNQMLDLGHQDTIGMMSLNKDKMTVFRRAYPFLNDRDKFYIEI